MYIFSELEENKHAQLIVVCVVANGANRLFNLEEEKSCNVDIVKEILKKGRESPETEVYIIYDVSIFLISCAFLELPDFYSSMTVEQECPRVQDRWYIDV